MQSPEAGKIYLKTLNDGVYAVAVDCAVTATYSA